MRAIQNYARTGLNTSAVVGLAAVALGLSAPLSVAATRLTERQLAELNACSDQQEQKVTAGPDHCAQFVAPARRHARVVLTFPESARMAECIDQQTDGGTEGAGDMCAEFVHWAKVRR